jgi:hypothetical protein
LTFKQIVQKAGQGVIWRGIGSDAAINGYKHRMPDVGYHVDPYKAGYVPSAKEPWAGAGRGTNKIDAGKVR